MARELQACPFGGVVAAPSPLLSSQQLVNYWPEPHACIARVHADMSHVWHTQSSAVTKQHTRRLGCLAGGEQASLGPHVAHDVVPEPHLQLGAQESKHRHKWNRRPLLCWQVGVERQADPYL